MGFNSVFWYIVFVINCSRIYSQAFHCRKLGEREGNVSIRSPCHCILSTFVMKALSLYGHRYCYLTNAQLLCPSQSFYPSRFFMPKGDFPVNSFIFQQLNVPLLLQIQQDCFVMQVQKFITMQSLHTKRLICLHQNAMIVV